MTRTIVYYPHTAALVIEDHDLYMPPWKDPVTEDPPRDVVEYELALAAWHESTAGGGLWDPEEG